MEQILNSENKVLSKGTQVSFALDEIYSNYPISVNISGNLLGSISGSCGDNVTGDIFTAGVYEIPAGQNSKNFSAKLTNKCSSIDATLSLTVSNGALYCTVDYTFQGQSFMAWDVSGQISVTKIYQEIPGYVLSYPACPEGYSYTVKRTYSKLADVGDIVTSPKANGKAIIFDHDSIEISASADTGYHEPSFGLNALGVNAVTDVSGEVTVMLNTTGKIHYPIVLQLDEGTRIFFKKLLYPAHPSFDCDGGCYCYCQDGSSVPWGSDCPATYNNYSLDYVTYGEQLYIQAVLPDNKFLDYIQIGNKKFYNTFFDFTANSETIVDGKLTVNFKIQADTWRTVNSDVINMGNYDRTSCSKVVQGIVAGRQTRITVSTGRYCGDYYEPGGAEPAWCDGGCYCYCDDGTQIDYGGTCGTWRTSCTTFEGVFTSNSAGTSITLANEPIIVNPTITINNNELVFNGYYNLSSVPISKTITITKVEQYF